MKAVVVYESHWGNTEAVARAIADGLGEGARALTTDEASGDAIAGADLIVAGAPVMAFGLPSDKMRDSLVAEVSKAPRPPDLSHESMRSWLDRLPAGHGRSATFDTRIWWSPGGATGPIDRGLRRAGYMPIDLRNVRPAARRRARPCPAMGSRTRPGRGSRRDGSDAGLTQLLRQRQINALRGQS